MATINDIRQVLNEISNLGIKYENYFFNKELINSILPINEIVEHINFNADKKDCIFMITINKTNNERFYYSNYKVTNVYKVFTDKMYNIIYKEIYNYYNNAIKTINKFKNCDNETDLYNIVLNEIVNPYMNKRRDFCKNSNDIEYSKYKYNRYNTKALISYGKRQIDDTEYKALIIGKGKDYIGGIVINDDKFKYFAPLGGETSFKYKKDNIISEIHNAIRFICG